MTDADHPTASSRPHVVDMFHAALTTLPHGGAGNSEPQADADLAIDPKLGSRTGKLLSRLHHGGEEVAVTKKQVNGGKRIYRTCSLRHEIRGGEGPTARSFHGQRPACRPPVSQGPQAAFG